MQRSILERVFPKPKGPLLPQYDEPAADYHDEDQYRDRPSSPAGIRLSAGASLSRTSTRSSTSRGQNGSHVQSQSPLQTAPLSASIVHHDDPFLAVDRAAANLQKTIQSLLDFQSHALAGRLGDNKDETNSQTSATPTQSSMSISPSASRSTSRVTPVRQPRAKQRTLRGARRELGESMREFALLKEQELKITKNEARHRKSALDRAHGLEMKREAVQHEVTTLKQRASGSESEALRSDAATVEQEIRELENRLMELRAHHKHLTDRATQLENTAASELSSYEGTLAAIDKDTRSFLRRPPVKQGLRSRNLQDPGQDMYDLRPDRRTLELAKEQWTDEVDLLEKHEADVELERNAFVDGARMWSEVVQMVDDFEKHLRKQMKSKSPDPASDLVKALDKTMQFLTDQLAKAESDDWKLLVCTIAAELEAFKQARTLLAPDEPVPDFSHTTNANPSNGLEHTDEDSDVPHADLLGEHSPKPTSPILHNPLNQPTPLESSNESLKATLREFRPPSDTNIPIIPSASISAASSKSRSPPKRDRTSNTTTARSESEDDDPGPDFLLSNH